MKWCICFLTILAVAAISCKKSNSGSSIPEISLIGISKTTIIEGGEDTVFIAFRIVDGDANLSNDTTGIFLEDMRNDSVYLPYEMNFPEIPQELQDAGKGIDAICTLTLDGSYFYFRPDDTVRHIDTMKFRFYIKDKALNKSNTITTPEILITR